MQFSDLELEQGDAVELMGLGVSLVEDTDIVDDGELDDVCVTIDFDLGAYQLDLEG